MNAPAKIQETKAEQSLNAQFDAIFAQTTQENANQRKQAWDAFKAKGIPHRRVEEWHYTDLRTKMNDAFALASKTAPKADALKGAGDLKTHRIAIVNGRYAPELSSDQDIAGLSIAQTNGFLAAQLGTDDAMAHLNQALVQGGISIKIDANAKIELPIEIVRYTDGSQVSSYAGTTVEIGSGAKTLIIESFEGDADAAYQSNALTEVKVGDKADVHWLKLQVESAKAQHIETLSIELGAETNFQHFIYNEGASLSRAQLFLEFKGEGTHAGLRGTSLLKDNQHADITLFVKHAVPGCESREYYRSVVDDKARAVFQGKIIVEQAAQKTDGQMMIKTLLLSDTAEINAKPELEIFADDVQCAHGSTTGDIDEDLLFYLMARGIPEAQARKILVLAFLSEAIEEFEEEQCVELLEAMTRSWLHADDMVSE
ncbi:MULTISPECIES: Fe-S cluster assembly protein SufD [unclassified Pseudovibrio]|uniref:Fe-S cluster assembly protein SufD n=1 Tax=unclassified Pseudovibrio TaxID=2627060 RepID=UPI0007AE9138|nr:MULTISPECIES: Fe-S cluster assembly protein SufD [unclassified Pseudovibrio]KZL02316.1 FeS cluster assembly protein SufD [Pseudovibrio sp. W74]KZL08140.1 FeS cluster assembly protein SufD [Pseudovibrio sp. Ad14]